MSEQTKPAAPLALTVDEAYSLSDYIENNLITCIRDDPDIDSMEWVCNMVHAYEKLCDYSGYPGKKKEVENEV